MCVRFSCNERLGFKVYTKYKYSFKDLVLWTRHETVVFFVLALVPAFLIQFAGWDWLKLPWTPITLIGTAVAFLIGFQNNAAYGRAWEARKIWGGIVNLSRTFGIMVNDMVSNQYATNKITEQDLCDNRRTLVYRHIAWLTALRHAMRTKMPWETFSELKSNRSWKDLIKIPERELTLSEDLSSVLSKDELSYVMSKTNKSTAILKIQSNHLRSLAEKEIIWEFSFLEFESMIKDLLDQQGKSERIKNFPYPRQYSTMGHELVRVFVLMLPFGIVPEFSRIGAEISVHHPTLGANFIWLGVFFSVIVSWVFNTMQKIGHSGENPFEGSGNDVPISTISRAIEIDLREMLDESKSEIPKPLPPIYDVQM